MQRGKNVIANPSNRGLLGSPWGVTSDKASHSPLPLSKFLQAIGGYVVFTSHKNQPYSSTKTSLSLINQGPKCCKDQLERSARKDAKLDLLMLNFYPKHAPVSAHTLQCQHQGKVNEVPTQETFGLSVPDRWCRKSNDRPLGRSLH